MKGLEKHTESIYAVLRIVVGFMFLFHGLQKIFGVMTDHPLDRWSQELWDQGWSARLNWLQMWLGGAIEFSCGTLVMLGLKSRWAAFLASGTMAVAYFQFHWKFQFDGNFFPVVNRGEMAVLYCFIFLLIAAKGSGKWSLDGGK